MVDRSSRRVVAAGAAGVVAARVAALAGAPGVLVGLVGWIAGGLTFLLTIFLIIARCDGDETARVATVEDDSRNAAHLALVGASVASLAGVGVALGAAGDETGGAKTVLTAVALGSIVVAWLVVNGVYVLRYAHLYFTPPAGGIDFPGTDGQPDYRDFAYLAFTIGMTYQVSDTGLRTPRFRRTLLGHALLSYLFATVIVATAINIVAGLLR
jgi:uncharacterized membrane protein